ncbi:MAG: DMT family transporter [Planctomycetes bacterium]|nr:DMT family transporter [Planctomycetota bacterium]
MSAVVQSTAGARLCLVLAAVLWSTGSVFMRLLREPLGLGLESPALSPLLIAFYRGLFGGLFMLALVRRGQHTFRPVMIPMVVTFTVMSGLYLSALGLGAAANAIFLQNTAPVWVFVFAVVLLGESGDRRGWQTVFLAATGAVVIVAGGWPATSTPQQERQEIFVLLMGLGSGVVYAGVVLFLRVLRGHAAVWLVALNLLGTAIMLGLYMLIADGPTAFVAWVTTPSAAQFAVLAACGVLQMGVPYWLFTRSLRSLSAQEAAIITLIEPLLNPVWAYLLTPHTDTPTPAMFLGGSLILLALVWKYVPFQRKQHSPPSAQRTQREDRQDEKNMA